MVGIKFSYLVVHAILGKALTLISTVLMVKVGQIVVCLLASEEFILRSMTYPIATTVLNV